MALTKILGLAIIVLIVLIIILAFVFLNMSIKEKSGKKQSKNQTNELSSNSNELNNSKEKMAKSYTKESIFKFMEFDKIEDNMIIQKGGKKFLMVVECQGINFDLMSDIEKTSVESGFIQFLNTLRSPIQIYVQTRTINLEDSIRNYKDKLKKIESDLQAKEAKYKAMVETGKYSKQQLDMQQLEIRRQTNLYDYGRDIIFNTERMSMNKNVLRKKYYIILSYYYSDTDGEYLKDYEIRELAFSDLYTKCQSTIRALAMSGVNGRVLDSYELVDLLYNAYNRDEAENYGIERAQNAGYDNLYITSPDILKKKMDAIEKTIQDKALILAEDSIKYAQENFQKLIEEKEESMDDLIQELASELIDENEEYIGEQLATQAKKQVRKSKTAKKGEGKNVKKTKE